MGDTEQDLLEAALKAPKFGLNAKALILQHALQQDGDEDQSEEAEAARAQKRHQPDPAAAAASFAAKRGAEYLAAVDAKERPQVAFVARSKIPRISRQTVLNKLVGEHLALAALPRRLRPQHAVADGALRQTAFEAATAQELELYGRCSSAVVYQNLAARMAAVQWPPVQQALQAEAEERQRRLAQEVAQQQQQQGGAGGRGADAGAHGTACKHLAAGQARKLQQLEEAELDWESAAPVAEEDEGQTRERAGRAAAEGNTGSQERQAGSAAGAAVGSEARSAQRNRAAGSAVQAAPTSAQTLVGDAALQPLAPLPPASGLPEPASEASQQQDQQQGQQHGNCQPALPAPATQGAAAGDAGAGVDTPAAEQTAPGGSDASASAAPAGVPPPEAGVGLQVELFIKAELHPLLKRQQISQEIHDAVCAKCVAKVMQRHADATSADFLVEEAGSIRGLVRQYLKHIQQRQQQP